MNKNIKKKKKVLKIVFVSFMSRKLNCYSRSHSLPMRGADKISDTAHVQDFTIWQKAKDRRKKNEVYISGGKFVCTD